MMIIWEIGEQLLHFQIVQMKLLEHQPLCIQRGVDEETEKIKERLANIVGIRYSF